MSYAYKTTSVHGYYLCLYGLLNDLMDVKFCCCCCCSRTRMASSSVKKGNSFKIVFKSKKASFVKTRSSCSRNLVVKQDLSFYMFFFFRGVWPMACWPQPCLNSFYLKEFGAYEMVGIGLLFSLGRSMIQLLQ